MHPARYNVIWTTPSADATGSLPAGNGDLALNAWLEPSGDVCLLLAKSDAWGEYARLLKVGRLRLTFRPNPLLREPVRCRQELRLHRGEIRYDFGAEATELTLRIWVDAHHPVIRVEVDSEEPVEVTVALDLWRTAPRELRKDEMHSAFGWMEAPHPLTVPADTVVDHGPERLAWYHRNEHSHWRENLALQGLADAAERHADPLLYRTFGGVIAAAGLTRRDPATLHTPTPIRHTVIAILLHTAQSATPAAWLQDADRQLTALLQAPLDAERQAHREWWAAFWSRSWIAPADPAIGQGYALQRYLSACAGRGRYPIKFNGSLFTVDMEGKDPDYRRWGGPYWWQNTRLPYGAMLMAGDFDLMPPLFRMYHEALPLARERTQAHFQHEGVYFPETMEFWGTWTNHCWGWQRDGEEPGIAANRYIRREWQGGLELVALMLDYFAYARDGAFLQRILLPFAHEILAFYDRHYPRDPQGRLHLAPAQVLETWWLAENPTPEIAGLHAVLDRLLALDPELVTPGQRHLWQQLRGQLPPLPIGDRGGHRVILPALRFSEQKNIENGELYPVYPYALYGVGKPDLELARETYAQRTVKKNGGWHQDAIDAALLGLTDEAARLVHELFSTQHAGSRFPAFWGPNYDWIPDQDHGSVAMLALQRMLLQVDGERLLLFPAWPKAWDVEFRLHAPGGTTVEAKLQDGQLRQLRIAPRVRWAKVEILSDIDSATLVD